MKQLIKETAWSRTYEVDGGMRMYESKFKVSGLAVGIDHVQFNWPNWNDSERLDFAKAFSAKSEFTSDETRILEFVMKNGSDVIASIVANAITRGTNKETALELIFARLRSTKEEKANFFQALRELRDQRAVPVLKEFHDDLQRALKLPEVAKGVIFDYLSCCTSLARLTDDSKYREVVESYVTSEDETIRGFATTLMELELKR